jgi:hypothetical protein
MRDSRAVAKLTHEEQKEIYAFILCGVPNEVISRVFEVGDRTLRRVARANSKSYPEVYAAAYNERTEWEYCRAYITERREREIREIYPRFTRPAQPPDPSRHVWIRFP